MAVSKQLGAGPTASELAVLIGIDVGSTSVRAIAFDPEGRKVAGAARPTPIQHVNTGGEYDPNRVFTIVLETLSAVAADLAGRHVAGIAATSIGESCVLVDATGEPVAPSIVWYDRRTLSQARAIEDAIGRDHLFQITGQAVDPIFTLTKLIWMRQHWPEAMARACRVMMMADWIAFRLCGVGASEPSLASRTLYFDIRNARWSSELLALAGFDASFPAPLRGSGAALGPADRMILAETGLVGTPVVAVAGQDHVIGSMASGLLVDGTVVDSTGTAEGLMVAASGPLADPQTIRRGYVQGAMMIDRFRYYVMGSILSSGGAIEWLRSIVGDASQADLIAAAVTIPAGSHGVLFLPHLVSGPPPKPDPYARAAFVGLTPAVTPATLYRAVLEGLAMQSRLILDGLIGLAGIAPVHHIRLIGGLSRNRLFVSIKANVLGCPIVVSEEAEATALGAALLAGVAAGVFPTFDAAVANLRLKETIVEPDDTRTFYEELLSTAFQPAGERLRPVNRELHRLSNV